ncbi:thiamine diphosphokinase [Bacillus marinisedimentorum]|uniref:thiamine diphosphokinase n=1 Tax=Bacillus marinisedimentorum TaxID=1821260 RepID=UPI0009F6DFBA
MLKTIVIAAGSPEISFEALPEISGEVIWAGADRGVYHLLKAGIVPEQAFGDFDSLADEELEWVRSKLEPMQIKIYPKEKDKTDLELAVEWALAEPETDAVHIIGATGGRLDHTMSNIQLLLKGVEANIPIILSDAFNRLELLIPGSYETARKPGYDYISFLPFTEKVEGLTLNGFKYPLKNETIRWGATLTVSNELAAENGTFSFKTGILLVIKSKD